MKESVGSLILAAVLSITTGLDATANAFRREPQWCRADAPQVSFRRDKGSLLAILAKHGSTRRPVSVAHNAVHRVTPAHRPALQTAAKPLYFTPGLYDREFASNCSGSHASILCPGYQLVGAEY